MINSIYLSNLMINEKNPNVISHNNHNTLDKEKNN